MTETSHYISFQHILVSNREALAALLTYYAGLLPADRKINTAGSLPGQTLSRIHHNSRQQPEVVSTVPDLVHLPRGDGGPLLVLPKSVQLCREEAKTKRGEGGGETRLVKVLSSPKNLAAGVFHRTKSCFASAIKMEISLAQRCFRAEAPLSRRGAEFFILATQVLGCLGCSVTCLGKTQ